MINFIAKKTLQSLRTAVVLGIMAMLLQACTEKLPGDDVAESTSAQEDASAAGTDTKAKGEAKAKDGDEGKTKGDLELGDECDADELCASGNCDEGLCASAGPKFSLQQKMQILRLATIDGLCHDNSESGDESDVDCGGSCPNKCEDGQDCKLNSDCGGLSDCIGGTCIGK